MQLREAIPGLDFLLDHPDFLQHHPSYNMLYIPDGYIPKLIALKTKDPLNWHYDQLLTAFHRSQQRLIFRSSRPDPNDLPDYDPKYHEYQVIAVAQGLSPYPDVLTDDPGLRALALRYGLPVVSPQFSSYTGRRVVKANFNDADMVSALPHMGMKKWHELFPSEPELQPNEFVVLNHNGHETYFRFDAAAHDLVPLSHWEHRPPIIQRIQPRTAGQVMFYDSLLSPPEEMPIVIGAGEFGTGKTFLSVAAAYAGVLSGQYERIIICPRDARLGDDIGAVPGDTYDKARTKARSIEDALRAILRIVSEDNGKDKSKNPALSANVILTKKVSEELMRYFDFVPFREVGGRSFSHSFIICDEFQDTNPIQARELITRLGNHSKLALLGDLKQINNPSLTRKNNGLNYVIDHIAGKPEVAYVSFLPEETTRHPATRDLVEYLI